MGLTAYISIIENNDLRENAIITPYNLWLITTKKKI